MTRRSEEAKLATGGMKVQESAWEPWGGEFGGVCGGAGRGR